MLTNEELAALDKLTDAINAIHDLPACHPADYAELVPHFHAIQEKVMARAAVRAHPDVFRSIEGFGEGREMRKARPNGHPGEIKLSGWGC